MKNLFKKLFVGFTVLSLTACGSTTMQDNTFAAKENKDFTKYTNQLELNMLKTTIQRCTNSLNIQKTMVLISIM